MNLSKDKVTEIFYFADNFRKEFYKAIEIYAIEEGGKARRGPRRKPKMSSGEVVTIMVLFHYGAFRNLKHFYLHYVCRHMRGEFPQTVSYNRFVELMEKEALSMAVMLKMFCLGECTGISYVDSTPLRVCKNKRIHSHKVFKGLAQVGKSTMGWFYGFKLHLLTNTLAAMIAYSFFPKKPAIKFEVETSNQLALF